VRERGEVRQGAVASGRKSNRIAVNAGACSSTSASMPDFLRAIAVASPPVPPPGMITRTVIP